MGSSQPESIRSIDLVKTPVYCMGYSEDIHFAADLQHLNHILEKLKQYEGGQMFKYRIREHSALQYFCQYAQAIIVVKPWKGEDNVLGMITITSKYNPKAQNVMTLVRRELKIDEKQSVFLYLDGKLLQTHQVICPQQQRKEECKVVVLRFSKMEISG